jgi:hypothetical protein
MQNSNSVVSRISKGLQAVSDEQQPAVVVMKEAPQRNCETSVSPTSADLINSENISKAVAKHVELNVVNGFAGVARIVLGSRASQVKGNELYNMKAETATEVYGQNSTDVDDQGGDAVASTQEFGTLTDLGGFLITKVEIFSTNANQLKQSASLLSLTPNFESKEIRFAPTRVDDQLNYAVIDNCMTPLDSMNGIIYPVLEGESVDIVLHYVATGLTTKAYSEKSINA